MVQNEADALDTIFSIIESDDVLLIMGAGSVNELTRLLKHEVECLSYDN